MIAYFLWRLATLLARAAPLRTSYRCAVVLADLVFLCWREKRENAIDNMRHVLENANPATVRGVARQSFRNYAMYLVDFIRTPNARREDLERTIDFYDWEAIDAAFGKGKGVMFVLMHFGSWDMGGTLFSQRGYRLNVIAETMEHGKLNAMVVGARTLSGMRVIPMERAAFSIVRALRRNEALAILIDRPQAENGVSVRFFGSETVLPAGPARIALRTGARVVPVAMVRLRGATGRLMGIIDPHFAFERTGDDEHDVRALTEAILRVHEGIIRRFPDQWYMFRRMWPPVSAAASAAELATEA